MSWIRLHEFLLARIDEDEEAARGKTLPDEFDPVTGEDWKRLAHDDDMRSRQPHSLFCGWRLGEGLGKECSCNYPARLLAECQAKRSVVYAYLGAEMRAEDLEYGSGDDIVREENLENVLMILAQPYADHPDYNKAWRP